MVLPQFRTLPPEECRQALQSLETHYQEFLRESRDSRSFAPEERQQLQREYEACARHHERLRRGHEKGGTRPRGTTASVGMWGWERGERRWPWGWEQGRVVLTCPYGWERSGMVMTNPYGCELSGMVLTHPC